LVLLIAMLNPKSFLSINERVTSMALNLEAGLFIVWMLMNARKYKETDQIPFVLPNFVYSLRWITMFYFGFAVVYDFVSAITRATGFDYL
jgi:hypothetical protein